MRVGCSRDKSVRDSRRNNTKCEKGTTCAPRKIFFCWRNICHDSFYIAVRVGLTWYQGIWFISRLGYSYCIALGLISLIIFPFHVLQRVVPEICRKQVTGSWWRTHQLHLCVLWCLMYKAVEWWGKVRLPASLLPKQLPNSLPPKRAITQLPKLPIVGK